MVEIDKKHSTPKIRSLALKKYLETNVTQYEIANTFHISKRTFRRWLQQYNEDNSVDRRNRENISYKIEAKHVKYAITVLKKDQTISMKRLLEIVRKKYPKCQITSQHLGQILRDNNITRKRTTIRHYPELRYGKLIDLKKELKIFYKNVNKLKTKNNKLLYSVPYRPKTNAIESWFSQFKYYLKLSHFVTFQELQIEVKNSINCIKRVNYKNYFIYAYESKDVRKVDKIKSTQYRTPKKYKN